jgi:gamma-glutamylcyclotransferase (GGCT)/AIG2-like uncharacterized protein YtfP
MLTEQGRCVGEYCVSGRLYDFGRYPGARPEEGYIVGEIFHLIEPGATLAALDEYEGPEFERSVVSIAGAFDCWIYWYVGPAQGVPIASGDWFQR